jgi:hypothetical protein
VIGVCTLACFFWAFYCLSFFDLQLLITPYASSSFFFKINVSNLNYEQMADHNFLELSWHRNNRELWKDMEPNHIEGVKNITTYGTYFKTGLNF